MSTEKIPILDYQGPWSEFVDGFGDAFMKYGFAVVRNHGVDPGLFWRMYSAMNKAFALPEEIKRKYEVLVPKDAEHAVGWVPFGTEKAKDSGIPDLKEFWEVRLRGRFAPHMRFPAEVPEFESAARELFGELDTLSRQLLMAIGWYLRPLKIAPDRFSEATIDGDSMMRPLYYPPLDPAVKGLRSAPHEDINFITLLVSATSPGLQVKLRTGGWIEVDNGPDDIIVNAGDMLQELTEWLGRRIPSTTHQVLNLPGERLSIPFFVHPREEIELSPGVTAGQRLKERLAEINLQGKK